jgi:hypothetical protein
MSKLKVLSELFSNPKEIITLGYQAMVRKRHTKDYEKMVADKFNIKRLPTIDLLDLEPGLNDTVNVYSYLPNTSTVPDVLLLRLLAKKFKHCSYLEIGSFRGESLAAMAEVTKDCTSITLSKEELKAFGFSDEEIKVHGIFSDGIPGITSIFHNSLTFDFDAHKKKYDLIFVDGDHVYESVVKDTQNVFKLLKDENSIIVWHDYGNDPVNVRYEVFAAILEGTPEAYRKNLYHVSNTMCAVFMRGKFATTYLASQPFPNKTFKVTIEAKKL